MLETFNKSAALLGALGFILMFVPVYAYLGITLMGVAGAFLLLGGCIRLFYWIKEKKNGL